MMYKLRPNQWLKGDSFNSTKLGALRWSFRRYYREIDAQRHDVFCAKLMESEPEFPFSSYARAVRLLPESAWNGGSEWSNKLSPEAESFLKRLDTLYLKNPLAAIKVASIAAGSTPWQYFLFKEASKRVCLWLRKVDISLQTRIHVGMLVRDIWPQAEWQMMEGLDKALMDLLIEGAATDAGAVWQIVSRARAKFGERSPLVFSFGDDPSDLLALGLRLREIAPDFCKAMMGNYLFKGRYPIMNFTVVEVDARRIADELFELESRVPSSTQENAAHTYCDLIRWGFPDEAGFGQALTRLYELACLSTQPNQGVRWLVMVAVNAPQSSPLRENAMERYGQWARGFIHLPLDNRQAILDFLRLLLDTLPIVCNDAVTFGRNVSLPANPSHPLVQVIEEAYWGLVNWLINASLPFAAAVLVETIMRKDLSLAEHAASRLGDVYEQLANLDVQEAERTLFTLARRTLNSDVDDRLKARCLNLFEQLFPILKSIDPEAASRSKREGFHNPVWDIF